MRVAAIALDARAQVLELVHAPAGQHHAGAGRGQRARKLRAQTAGRPGHECHAAR